MMQCELLRSPRLLRWEPSVGSKCPSGTGCSNIMADVRFYPKGAAKAHFTAHNAKDPKETARRDPDRHVWLSSIYKYVLKYLKIM